MLNLPPRGSLTSFARFPILSQRGQNSTNHSNHTSNTQACRSRTRALAARGRRSANNLCSRRVKGTDFSGYSCLNSMRDTLGIPTLACNLIVVVAGTVDRTLSARRRRGEDGCLGAGVGWCIVPGGLDAEKSLGKRGRLRAVQTGRGGGVERGDGRSAERYQVVPWS